MKEVEVAIEEVRIQRINRDSCACSESKSHYELICIFHVHFDFIFGNNKRVTLTIMKRYTHGFEKLRQMN